MARQRQTHPIHSPALLASDAATVISVATHFRKLKFIAASFSELSIVGQRGYFQPHEEETIRHLQVSYWQARCALIEVVTSLHRESLANSAQRESLFLIAFAGAIVLIDAARFLRIQFHSHPVIREKLNEPEPNFGLPLGMYDTIQESLTRPRHIWHLYHAISYWQQQEPLFRQQATQDPQTRDLLTIIDERIQTLTVSLQEYASARMRLHSRQVWTSLRRDLVSQALYGLQKLAGDLAAQISVRPGHRPGLPPAIVDELRQLLLPGDVIISRRDYALTNYFLPGHWPHAALYLGDAVELERRGLATHTNFQSRWINVVHCDSEEPKRVLEAMKDGVRIRSLRSPTRNDSIVILRPQLSDKDVTEALARGMFHEGKQYDFGFDFTRSDRLVCTEVVYRAYEGVGGMAFRLTQRAGRMTLSAGDLLAMGLTRQHFTIAAVYDRETDQNLVTETRAEQIVRTTIERSA